MPGMVRDFKRDAEIVALYKSSLSQTEIAVRFNLCRERVRQILARNGLTRKDGGYAVRVVRTLHREPKNVYERFWSQVDVDEAKCWIWIGARNKFGYGQFKSGSCRYAHRVSYEMCCGQIPDGLMVLHTCDNPPCVNPDHLWLGTAADNMADCVAKGRHVSVLYGMRLWRENEIEYTI